MIYFPRPSYGLIETGVPTSTELNNSPMSSFSSATILGEDIEIALERPPVTLANLVADRAQTQANPIRANQFITRI